MCDRLTALSRHGPVRDQQLRGHPTPPRLGFLLRRVELYHPARLNALAELCDRRGVRLEVAETTSRVLNHPAERNPSNWQFNFRTLDRKDGKSRSGGKGPDPKEQVLAWLESFSPRVICFIGYSSPVMRTAARWARSKTAASVLISSTTELDRRRRFILESVKGWWVRRYVDAAFTCGARSWAYLKSLGVPGHLVWRSGNAVDNEWWAKSCAEAKGSCSSERSKSFLYVGRLAAEKNVDTLIRAYAQYRKDMASPWDLIIVGDGPQAAQLRRLADRLGVQGVQWMGYKQPSELPEIYARADVLVLPSLREPWGLVVNEAMACGLTVLVSERCGCVPELVYPGLNGYVFDPHDPASLLKLLTRISRAPDRVAEMGDYGRQLVARFTPASWARALLDCASTAAGSIEG